MNNGGPAFPSHGSMGEVAHEGMTLRDWFAGKALIGLIIGYSMHGAKPSDDALPTDLVADRAYEHADAMLKAREADNA